MYIGIDRTQEMPENNHLGTGQKPGETSPDKFYRWNQRGVMINPAEGLLWYFAFVFSTVLHEASHAFMAQKLGDDTAHEQVTLHPSPHIRREPFGMVVVPLLSFMMGGWMIGWASTPYDPRWARAYPKRSALMALGGPLSNLTLVILSGLLIRLGMSTGFFYAPSALNLSHVTAATQGGIFSAVATLVSIFFSLNLLLCLFNLLPVPPLDGSGIIPLFLSDRQSLKYMDMINTPVFGLIGLLIAWNLFDDIFRPVHLFAIRMLYPEMSYH